VEIPVLRKGCLVFPPLRDGWGELFCVWSVPDTGLCDYQAKLTIYTGVLIAIATGSCETVEVPFAHLPNAVNRRQSLPQAEPTQPV